MKSRIKRYRARDAYEDALVFSGVMIDKYGLSDFFKSRTSYVLEARAKAYLREDPEIFSGLMRELQIVLSGN